MLLAGGNATAGQTWEIYDATTNTFPRHASAGFDLIVPGRAFHQAISFADGKVLLIGGIASGSELISTEVFDPNALVLGFGLSTSLDDPRAQFAAAYVGSTDLVVVVGGATLGASTEQVLAP